MGLVIKNKFIVGLFAVTILISTASLLYQNDKLPFLSKDAKGPIWRQKKIRGVKPPPTSYKECCERQKIDPEAKQRPYCKYLVTANESAYRECFSLGGDRAIHPCIMSDSNCTIVGCQLIYMNPNFIFPDNFAECREAPRSIVKRSPDKLCKIVILKQGVFNKEVGDKIYNDCLDGGGKVTKPAYSGFDSPRKACELIFYEN